MDPRLIWPLLISIAMLVLFCFVALAKLEGFGLIAIPPIILAFAAFVRSWSGKDDPPSPPPAAPASRH